MNPDKKAKAYDESSFRMLKGLEPVRTRPGMYTRTDSPTHIVQEVLDNAADEALAGFATQIDVVLKDDGSVLIKDNGRGIPVGLHPEEKIPVVTMAFTVLHAGGKFDKKDGGAYAFSGGLHGVGVAVTTALSSRVVVTVSRGGKIYEVVFTDSGRNIGDVKEIGRCPKEETGTCVQVWPDPAYFDSPKVNVHELERLLRSKAVLLPGVKVSFTIGTEGEEETKQWEYPDGLASYLADLGDGNEIVGKMYLAERYIQADELNGDGQLSEGEGASFAVAWYPEGGATTESYVNLIPTPAGGTHESGLKAGLYEAVKSFIEHHGLLPRGVKLQQEDVAAKMGFVLSAKILDPQFQGQIKEKLTSRPAHKLMLFSTRDPFEAWLNANIEIGKAIAELSIKAALNRQKSGQKVEKRKSSSISVLPGKLADCEATDNNELFLVEGDSAGGSAKQSRNRENQAILPLRGKVLNTWEEDPNHLFANNEIHDISVALGVDPHDIHASDTVLSGLRYRTIIIMTDADVDGSHIQTLLLTLFYKHFPRLVVNGHVAIAQPPLYRVDVASTGKGKPPRRLYALDDQERDALCGKLVKEGVSHSKIEVGRFKGLGEMNVVQLKETAMDPATRRVIPVHLDQGALAEINDMFNLLMGKSFAEGRRDWMALKGASVEADI